MRWCQTRASWIAERSHVRLARLDAGLFFICFQRDPGRSFIPVQTRLAGSDLLNEYIRHVDSGIFAVPGGAVEGSCEGAGLFGS